MPLPTEPNSDGWISFHRSGKGPFTLAETCAFRLPEDAAVDDRIGDAAGINLFPQELAVELNYGDLNEHLDVFVGPQRPEDQAQSFEALAAKLSLPPASGDLGVGSEASKDGRDDQSLAREEFQKIAQIWRQIADGTISDESEALIRTRLNLFSAWAQLADRLLDDADIRAAERVRQDVQRLRQRLVEGKPEVGDLYFDLITTLVHQMNRLRETNEDLVDRMVRWRVRWPALTAGHPSFRRYDEPPESLGSGYPFRMDKGSRWQPQKDHDQVALHLAFFIHRLKKALTRFAKEHQQAAKAFHPNLQRVLALGTLPEAVMEWWEVAEGHFLEAYPEPELNPRFQDWLTAPSHRKSPKEMRRRILERLQQSFVSVLGGNKLR